MWNTNENFQGTYRTAGLPEDKFDNPTEDYAEPILINDKPVCPSIFLTNKLLRIKKLYLILFYR